MSICPIKSVCYHLGASEYIWEYFCLIFPPSHSHPIHQLFLNSVSWWDWTACTIQLPYIGCDMKRWNINADSMRHSYESYTSIMRSPCFLSFRHGNWPANIASAYIDLSILTNEWRCSPQQGRVLQNNYPPAIICLPFCLCCIPAGKTNNTAGRQYCLSAGGQRDRERDTWGEEWRKRKRLREWD